MTPGSDSTLTEIAALMKKLVRSPVAPNRTEDGRAKNRRVELVENAAAAGK